MDLRASTDSEIIAAMIAAEEGSLLRGRLRRHAAPGGRLLGRRHHPAGSSWPSATPHGVRPLVLGRLDDDGWCVASETCALDQIGARYVRDVRPGEAVRLDRRRASSSRQALPSAGGRLCVFEHIYFARPDSQMDGRTVWEARRAMGAELARESPAEADLVVGLPDSGTPAAIGFARESGIPYAEAVVRNRYVGRSFIQPDQTHAPARDPAEVQPAARR